MTLPAATEPPVSITMLKECRHGWMLFLPRDAYIGRSLDLYGEFSEAEGDLFAQLLRPGDVAVEAGANMGAHTLNLGRLVGPSGMVWAFEPQRVLFQLLTANVAMNELFHIHTFHAALGREAGEVLVPLVDYAQRNNFGAIPMDNNTSGEAVRLLTLDSMDLARLDLLKVDVEGMEADVLAGAKGQITRHRPILYVENDRQAKSPALAQLIDSLGYDMWWHTPLMFSPANYARNDDNVFAGVVSINMLCIPKERSHETVGVDLSGLRPLADLDKWIVEA